MIELILFTEILQRHEYINHNLHIPYFPYARQDRITENSTSFSLKPICTIINNLNYNRIYLYDPHSDVTPALLNNVKVISSYEILSKNRKVLSQLDTTDLTVVSPDTGATKKAFDIARLFNAQFACGDKHRDVKTGNITGLTINKPNTKNILVVDDICDGGRTFIELAKNFDKNQNVYLYVTHGIFSKGLEELFQYYNKIITTNSFLTNYNHPNLEVLQIV